MSFRPNIRKCIPGRVILLVTSLMIAGLLSGQSTIHEYQSTSAVIANPGRGWYDDYYSHSGGSTLGTTYRPLKAAEIIENREKDKITLILRLFYLHDFLEQNEVSPEYLDKMQSDFDSIRSAGVKCIVRFAYSASQSAAVWDATPDKVFSHIESLRNVLVSNGDVIAGVQAGFIGAWGEWYYTKNFAGFGFKPDSTDQQNRITLVESLLDILPDHVTVQGRTPAIMKNLAKTEDPITEAEAFDGSFKSRIGHHNDCFLANSSDYGTYTNLTEDLAYLHESTKYTITGGETCDASNSYSDCVSGVPRMAELHWTYLNRDYNKAVYSKWEEQGCYGEINISLGYRIRLISATLGDSVDPGSSLNVSFDFSNDGYAAPTQYKPIRIVMTHTGSGEQTLLDYSGTNNDIRFWLPGEIHAEGSIEIPVGLEDGNYHLALLFPDKSPQLAENPAYSIQLANVGIWDSEKGQNSLNHIVSVGTGGEGTLPPAPTEVSASAISETEIDLQWTDVANDETGFEIMRSEGEGNDWEPLVMLGPNVEAYNDNNAQKGRLYSYIIRTLNEYGSSAWADSVQAATLGVSLGTTRIPSFDIYPNPLENGKLTIHFPDDSDKQIIISTITGSRLYSTSTRVTEFSLDRNIFDKGIYLIACYQGTQKIIRKLVVL